MRCCTWGRLRRSGDVAGAGLSKHSVLCTRRVGVSDQVLLLTTCCCAWPRSGCWRWARQARTQTLIAAGLAEALGRPAPATLSFAEFVRCYHWCDC